MASQSDDNDRQDSDTEESEQNAEALLSEAGSGEIQAEGAALQASPSELEGSAVATLGAVRYVHAAFIAAGILTAFLSGKLLTAVWNTLAEWPAAAEALPVLERYGEEERSSVCMLAGALIGLIGVVQVYRTASVRTWASEVAEELARVTWPTRETVQAGTIVVVVATIFSTIYVGLLDRFWGFVTNLVYGV